MPSPLSPVDPPRPRRDRRFAKRPLLTLLTTTGAGTVASLPCSFSKPSNTHARDLLKVACRPDFRGDVSDTAVEETYATLSAWLCDVAHVVIRRDDGRYLTSQWLHLKMADARSQRARHPFRSNLPPRVLNEEHLFGWITHGVAAAGFTTRDLRSFVNVPSNADIHTASTQQASSPENLLDLGPRPLDKLSIMAELDQLSRHASLAVAGTRLDDLDAFARQPHTVFRERTRRGS